MFKGKNKHFFITHFKKWFLAFFLKVSGRTVELGEIAKQAVIKVVYEEKELNIHIEKFIHDDYDWM
ncbi:MULTISPECIES: hypothetical protein [Enterococcus]|uniref:hypothetical protein n=1 Tax=Enterococcus TaxID=1350 RepID=UPI000A34B4B9|nr:MULTISPECIES: hypothetical protein [unclassified Enterococcus]